MKDAATYECSECGNRVPVWSRFYRAPERFCGPECAVMFLLRREENR